MGALAVYLQAVLAANSYRAFDNVNTDLAYAAVSVPSLLALERQLAADQPDWPEGLRLRSHGRDTPTAVGSSDQPPNRLLVDHAINGSRNASDRHAASATAVAPFAAMRPQSQVPPVNIRLEPTAVGVVPAIGYPLAGVQSQAPEQAVFNPDSPSSEIRCEGVTFRYPGRDADTLAALDLAIPAGRSLAIVGVNGAGKTTLVKLLCRLYEPTAGRIIVDGVDLRAVDARAWQRRVAAIFQDFARYHLTARDNVALGAREQLGDMERLRAAARRAGALDLIESLPRGWDTVLSRQYTDGVDLSGGQWQRIALARALLAVEEGALLLILDEPTASLDVRAEAELYDRFLDITAGLTTILISHRFSTVRRADRICVLADGRVAEQGTHDELMALSGRYAEMFTLQAARFAGGADEPMEDE